ncbi:MAG: hypothetical protein AAF939_19465, partial [Planctomycetota bacterium]
VTSKSSGLNISNNLFRDLNTSAIHLSGTDNVDGNEIHFNNNVIFNSNNQWDRANHSEGAITISLRADHIRIKGNLVAESDAAFVGYFHHDMEDWVVEENMVTATDRLFYSTARIAEPLEDIIWRNNFANDVGDSFAITIEDGITDNFVFDNNEINGGTLRFTGLTDGSVFGNTVRSSDDDPLRLENLNGTRQGDNTVISDYQNQGDGLSVLLTYNQLTGEVGLESLSMLGDGFSRFVLANEQFALDGLNDLGGDLLIKSKYGIGWANSVDIAAIELGAILPTGLSEEDFQRSFIFGQFTDSQGNFGSVGFAVVPEPGSVSVLALLTLWLCGNRRRNAKL